MNNTFLNRCYCYLLTLALVVPMVLQLEHVVRKNHDYTYCASPDDLHIEVHERDCVLYHQQIDNSSITFTTDETEINITVSEDIKLTNDTFFDKSPQRTASSRAPPFSLV